MRSLHNAAFHIIWDETQPPFNFFLSGRGDPEYVKELVRLTFRDRRRDIMSNPQYFAVNIFCRANAIATVTIMRPSRPFGFTYRFNIIKSVPTVRVVSHITQQNERFNLFEWIGPQRRLSKTPSINHSTLHNKRGRPSELSKMKEPVPDQFK